MIAKTQCEQCAGWLEFDLEGYVYGQETQCPHCQNTTAIKYNPRKGFESKTQKSGSSGWYILIAVGAALLLAGAFVWVVGAQLISALLVMALVAFAGFVYFLPTIVGRNKSNFTAIFVLNLLLGWSFIGWVVALVWACTVEQPRRN